MAAAAWKFLREGEPGKSEQALNLYALGRRIHRQRASRSCLKSSVIDKVLSDAAREGSGWGQKYALDVTTLNVAAHGLQSLVHDRRTLLAARPDGKAMA